MINTKLFFTKETLGEIERKFFVLLKNKQTFRIATINTEYLLEARRNTVFRESLLDVDAYVCDGIGVKWWYFFRYGEVLVRVTGVDISEIFLDVCDKQSSLVYIILRKGGLSLPEEIRRVLTKKYKNIDFRIKEVEKERVLGWEKIQQDIQNNSPDGVLCGLGIPEQEIFLKKLQIRQVKTMMIGVGGTFDFWTKKQKRAPLWMRRAGLEWVWRFSFDPKRIIRFFGRFTSR